MLRILYANCNDDFVVCEIGQQIYTDLLVVSESGKSLADALAATLVVVDDDPKQSLMDSCDLFVSHYDLYEGHITAQELHEELNEFVNSFS